MDSRFPELIRQRLLPVLEEHGLVLMAEDGRSMDFASPMVNTRVGVSPRGEFELSIYSAGSQPHEGWRYFGIVGRASLERLIDLATAEVEADPRILAGDHAFFAEFNSRHPRHLP